MNNVAIFCDLNLPETYHLESTLMNALNANCRCILKKKMEKIRRDFNVQWRQSQIYIF